MGTNFKREKDEEITSLAMDRDNVVNSINGFISAATPMYNKLKDMTDEQLQALYPVKSAACIEVRDFLATNALALLAKLNEFKGLLS